MRHPWNLTPAEAVALQKKLRGEVVLSPLKEDVRYVGGCDISMNLYSTRVFAGFVVLSYPELELVDHAVIEDTVTFPYVPGLLSFREIPPLLRAWEKLSIKPDVVCVDGVGVAHPRRMGIATHLGLALDVPTIGVAKSLLTGTYEQPDSTKGSSSLLLDRYHPEEVLGTVLRTKEKVKPIFVSPGYKVTLEDAERVVRACVRNYRIPEPTRLAHEMVNRYRKDAPP
jgi:deoxyribonuclease V